MPVPNSKHSAIIPKLIELYNQYPRVTHVQIAEQLNLPYTTVNQIIFRLINRGEIERRQKLDGNGYSLTKEQHHKLMTIAHLRLREELPWGAIAAHFNLSKQGIHTFVANHMPELLEASWRDKLIELYNSGITSTAELARHVNKHGVQVNKALKILHNQGKIKYTPGPAHRPRYSQAIIEKVQKIHSLRQAGITWREIAIIFGTNPKSCTALIRTYTRNKAILENNG